MAYKINDLNRRSGCGMQIYCPEINVAVDAGALAPGAHNADYLFLTHGHIDHFGAIASHVLRRKIATGNDTVVVCQKYMVEIIKDIMNSYRAAQLENAQIHPPLYVKYVTVDSDLVYMHMSKDLGVSIMNLSHSPKSVGYGFSWQGELNTCVLMDTDIQGIKNNADSIAGYRNVIIECTMLGESSICVDYKHLCLPEIVEHFSDVENAGDIESIAFTHFSPMYSDEDIAIALSSVKFKNLSSNPIKISQV